MECEPFHFDRHVLEARQLPTYSNICVCMKCAVLQMNLYVCLVLSTPRLTHQRCYSMIICHFTFNVLDVLLQESADLANDVEFVLQSTDDFCSLRETTGSAAQY